MVSATEKEIPPWALSLARQNCGVPHLLLFLLQFSLKFFPFLDQLLLERLNQTAPTTKLTGAQKKQLAELDSKYAAKIAEREIALRDEIAKAAAAGDAEKVELLQQQLVKERKKLQAELEEKKEQIRHLAK